MTLDTLFFANLGGVEPQGVFCIREHLFYGPSLREDLDDLRRFHTEIRRGEVTRLSSALGIADDHYAQFNARLGPPSVKGLHPHRYVFTVDVHGESRPPTARASNARELREPGTVLRRSSPLSSAQLREILPEAGVRSEPADQRDIKFVEGPEEGTVVVSTVSDEAEIQGSPFFQLSDGILDDLQSRLELIRRTGGPCPIQNDPEGDRDRYAEEVDDDSEDDPVVSPDVSRPRPSRMIEETPGPEDVMSPFRAERVVNYQEDLLEAKRVNNEVEEYFKKGLGIDFEVGEEPVEASLVAPEARAVRQLPNRPLSFMYQPRKRDRQEVRPAALGEGHSKVNHHAEKLRGIMQPHGLISSLPVIRIIWKIGFQAVFL